MTAATETGTGAGRLRGAMRRLATWFRPRCRRPLWSRSRCARRIPSTRGSSSSSKKFYAHDEQNSARLGDVVRIRETRPLSKLKRWSLEEIVRRSSLARLKTRLEQPLQ